MRQRDNRDGVQSCPSNDLGENRTERIVAHCILVTERVICLSAQLGANYPGPRSLFMDHVGELYRKGPRYLSEGTVDRNGTEYWGLDT